MSHSCGARTGGQKSLALSIVSGLIDTSKKELLYLDFLMTSDSRRLEENDDRLFSCLAAALEGGRDVALINLGDASVFSSYAYLAARAIARGIPVVTIPGVTSFCAAAARLNQSLTVMKEPLTIIPAAHTANLEDLLSLPGGKVLMKSGKSLPEVLKAIKAAGLSEKASLVCNCGLPGERAYARLRDFEDVTGAGYFTLILIRP